jgi:L-fucose isomerase-like protein
MTDYGEQERPNRLARCCPCGGHEQGAKGGMTRRGFLGGAALAGMALRGLSWPALSAVAADVEPVPERRPLVVKPILIHKVCTRRPQTSWRIWGGIQTEQDARQEVARIQNELAKLQSAADFPVRFLPVTAIRGAKELDAAEDLASADALILYAAGDYWFSGFADAIARLGKDAIVFSRFMSGPFYSSGTTVSPCLLRGGSNDQLAVQGVDELDIVVDSQEELLWRLRALCGLRNTIGSRIVAVGGPGGWGIGAQAPALAVDRWKLDIRTVEYKELGELIKAARADKVAVQRAQDRAAEYLKLPGTTLETDKPFVENAFLLEQVFRGLMREADCRAITVHGCMATIMPIAETSACLTLSVLNDAGYMAFCESDFVVIPAGILAANIAGRPMFLNDPCYPQHGVIALAHCTAPRMMDGKTREPARIVTHYESDYGAAPKVEMHKGQKVTNLIPDFQAKCLAGFVAEIVDAPFLPICRSQIVVRFACDSAFLARQMRGYHWITIYGDYLREVEYALKRTKIAFENLS